MSRSRSAEPVVSVVMSVYNAEGFLTRAIESVLTQTLEEFEFIIIDDGSTDNSETIIQSFDDSRIRSFSQSNKGVGAALNRGIEEARSELMARMDADDISMPDRLKQQVRFMKEHSDTVLLGSSFVVIDEYDNQIDLHPGITEDDDIRRAMYVRNPFPGGGVMMRRHAFRQAGAYSASLVASVDSDLFHRLAEQGKLANLPEILYCWRFTRQGITHTRANEQESVFQKLALELWNKASPRPLRTKEVRARLRKYRDLGRSARAPLEERYLENEFDLGVLMLRRGQAFGKGIPHLKSVLAADPVSVGTVLMRRYRRYLAQRFRVVRFLATKAKGVSQRRTRRG